MKTIKVVTLNRSVVFIIDAALLVLSYYGAYWMRFENINAEHWNLIQNTIVPVVAAKMVIFSAFGLYAGPWRFTGVLDLANLLKSSVLGFLTVMVGMIYFYYPSGFSRSVFVIDAISTVILVGCFRLSIRIAYSRQLMRSVLPKIFGSKFMNGRINGEKQILIYGANEQGEMLLRSFVSENGDSSYHTVGFVDDRRICNGFIIHGVKHLGGSDALERLVKKYEISEIMVASDPGKKIMERIFAVCQDLEVSCRVIPPYLDMVHHRLGVSQLRNIAVDDLLRRETVSIDYTHISEMIRGKKVLVTGAAGSIGKQLSRQLLEFNPAELICIDMAENPLFHLQQEIRATDTDAVCFYYCSSVTNLGKMDSIFSRHKPEIVFHAAAHKHVPLMESNVDEVIQNNICGTRNVADMSDKYNVGTFVFISTDKAVKPANIMGLTKRMGELYVQHLSEKSMTRFLSVRFGNVLGSNGSVVPIFRRQIEKGGPVTVTHPETTRYFMTIPEAVLLILQSAFLGKQGDLLILDMGRPIRITELAEVMIRMAGYTPGKEIPITFTGLRPGEKLHEELVCESEEMARTSHSKISVVKNQDYNGDKMPELINSVLAENFSDGKKAYAVLKERLGQKDMLKKQPDKLGTLVSSPGIVETVHIQGG